MTTTAYEVALSHNGQFVRALAVTERKTKSALINFARLNGAEILALMTDAEAEAPWSYADGVLTFGKGAVTVAFSGYTVRNPRPA